MPDKETEMEATVLKHVDKGYVSEDRVLGQRPELKKRTSHKSIWGKRGDLKLGGTVGLLGHRIKKCSALAKEHALKPHRHTRNK